MGTYVIRRLTHSVPVIVVIGFLCFVIVRLAPGDPVALLVDTSLVPPADVERLLPSAEGLGPPELAPQTGRTGSFDDVIERIVESVPVGARPRQAIRIPAGRLEDAVAVSQLPTVGKWTPVVRVLLLLRKQLKEHTQQPSIKLSSYIRIFSFCETLPGGPTKGKRKIASRKLITFARKPRSRLPPR
jgi:hypothetical protein